jgi:hypothetical protein
MPVASARPLALTLAAAAALLACSPAEAVTAPPGLPSTPAPARDARRGSATAEPDSAAPRATWVPRIAPAVMAYHAKHGTGMYGPVQNNFGTSATAYLGERRAGLLDDGRRFVFQNQKLVTVDAEAARRRLERVTAIDPKLGGGFVFAGQDGLFFADAFDGALRQLSPTDQPFEIAPSSLFLGGATLVATRDGKPIAGAPAGLEHVVSHPAGFAIARTSASAGPPKAWFTTDGRAWRELRVGKFREAVADGDALLVLADGGAVRVARDGKVSAAGITDDEAGMRVLASQLQSGESQAVEDGFEGALIDAAFARTGRADDEWFGIRHRRVVRVRARAHEVTPLGPEIAGAADGLCSASTLDGAPHVLCFKLGKRLDIHRVDLATGALTLEHSLVVKSGFARHIGSVNSMFPATLMVMATCDGDATTGAVCVRDDRGAWATFPAPDPKETMLAFPGELLLVSEQPDGSLELKRAGRPERHVFPPAEITAMRSALGVTATPGKGQMPPVVNAGYLRTAEGVRNFNVPNPFAPITKAVSYAVDLSLEGRSPPSVTSVEGVVAVAGMQGLRLANGKLWETNDGWKTWYEVEPPPTGAPRDLGGAMCFEAGCVVGPWARVGWQRPSVGR